MVYCIGNMSHAEGTIRTGIWAPALSSKENERVQELVSAIRSLFRRSIVNDFAAVICARVDVNTRQK